MSFILGRVNHSPTIPWISNITHGKQAPSIINVKANVYCLEGGHE